MQDAEWHAKDYSPTFKERLELGLQSSSNNKLCCAILVGVGSIGTKKTFEWVDSNPDPVRALAEIGRLSDDIATYEVCLYN
jgi:Terpene synthase family, metal binding domain